eukprot:2567918-Amphidinium_carterae.1
MKEEKHFASLGSAGGLILQTSDMTLAKTGQICGLNLFYRVMTANCRQWKMTHKYNHVLLTKKLVEDHQQVQEEVLRQLAAPKKQTQTMEHQPACVLVRRKA